MLKDQLVKYSDRHRKLRLASATLLLLLSLLLPTAANAITKDDLTLVTDISTLNDTETVVLALTDKTLGVTGWNGIKDAAVSENVTEWKQYELTKSEGSSISFKLKDVVADKYIASPGTNNTFTYGPNAGACSLNNDNVFQCNGRPLCQNGTNYRFYANVGQYTPFYLYKVNQKASVPRTVTFDAGSGSCDISSRTESTVGAGVTLPNATGVKGWEFAGWATESVESTTTVLTLMDANTVYNPSEDCTLYAVYSRYTAGNGIEKFVKITSIADVNTTNEYLLVISDGDKLKASGNSVSSNALGTFEVTVENNDIVAYGDAKTIKLKLFGEKYCIEIQGDTKYYIKNNSSTNLSLPTSNPPYDWSPVVYGTPVEGIYMKNSSDRYLGNSNSGTIKAYINTNTYAPAFLYMKTDGSYTTYNSNPTAEANVAVTGVTLDQNTASVQVGGTVTLTATVAPDNATNDNVTWSTNAPAIATVEGGVVTGVAQGSATITVTTVDGNFTADCTVTVNPSYTVTYNANGGIGSMTDSNSPYAKDAVVTVAENAFTREGYNFTGWNTNQEGTGTAYSAGDTFTITEDVILYAQWVECKELTFDFSDLSNIFTDEACTTNVQSGNTNIVSTFYYREDAESPVYTFTMNSANSGSSYFIANGNITSAFFGKKDAYLEMPKVKGYKITNITTTASSNCSKDAKLSITVSEGNTVCAEKVLGNNVVCNYAIPADYQTSVLRLTQTASSRNAQINKIKYTLIKDVVLEDPELAFVTDYELFVDEEDTVSCSSGAHSTGVITYSTEDTDVISLNDATGHIIALAPGTATVTATITNTDVYASATATCEVTVIPNYVSVTTNHEGWTTYAPSYNVTLPENQDGLKFYYVKELNDAGTHAVFADLSTDLEDYPMEAGTGFLIKSDNPNTEVTFECHKSSEGAFNKEDLKSLLIGVTEDTHIDNVDTDNYTNYIFTKKESYGLGFFKWTSGELVANKCFLQLPTGSNPNAAQMFISLPGDDTVTSVEDLFNADDDDAPIYTPMGVRVSKEYKGIVIKNGKKYVNK